MRGLLLILARLLEVLKIPHLRIATICMRSALVKGRMREHAKAPLCPPFSPHFLAVLCITLRPRLSCARPAHAVLAQHVLVLHM